MDFRQIKYFMAVAERRSFTAASEAVRIAQPALSTQIANLEKELGTALFERHPRGVTLTPSGEIFLDYAFRLRDTLSEARDAVLNTVPEPKGMVTLGLPMTTSVALTAPLIEEVRKTYPMIDLRVVEGLSGDIFAWLLDGRLDIGILYADCMPHPFEATLLVEDDLFLIGRPGSAPTLSEEVSFEELCHYYLIHTSSTHSAARFDSANLSTRYPRCWLYDIAKNCVFERVA
jgi:LysR family nitrogen assimilation transcriptional regulator